MTLRRLVLSKELYLAVLTLLLGLWCLDQTRGLDGDAWSFPFYLSVSLCVLGVAQFLQCWFDKSERTVDREAIAAILQGALPIAAIAGLWALALDLGLGYLLPSVVAVYTMLVVMRYGTPTTRLIRAVLTTAVIFTMFYIIFDSPLPVLESVDDFFHWIGQSLRD